MRWNVRIVTSFALCAAALAAAPSSAQTPFDLFFGSFGSRAGGVGGPSAANPTPRPFGPVTPGIGVDSSSAPVRSVPGSGTSALSGGLGTSSSSSVGLLGSGSLGAWSGMSVGLFGSGSLGAGSSLGGSVLGTGTSPGSSVGAIGAGSTGTTPGSSVGTSTGTSIGSASGLGTSSGGGLGTSGSSMGSSLGSGAGTVGGNTLFCRATDLGC